MSNKKKVKELQQAYELCKKIFCTGTGIMEVGVDFALEDQEKHKLDQEKYEFFCIVYEYFAKKKQKELIEKGVY